MNAQQIIGDSRVLHIRELKAEVAKLKAENARLRDENAMLAAHFDLAVTAAEDLRGLEGDAKLVLVDGWNLILGARRSARDKEDLLAQARAHLVERPKDLVWVVFDGPRFSSVLDGRLRVTYTGGSGAHRADRFICDFVRMARFRGDTPRIEVRTDDRDFRREIDRLLGV